MKFPAVHQGEDDFKKSLYGQKKLQVEKQTILFKMADFKLHNMAAGNFFDSVWRISWITKLSLNGQIFFAYFLPPYYAF